MSSNAGIAYDVLLSEASALSEAAARIGGTVDHAADMILSSNGRIIVTGIGKSGIIAQKIAATLCSIGFSSTFLHATEAVHGDLGVYKTGDVTIMLSKSGTTPELFALIPILHTLNSPTIGILGNITTGLAKEIDCVIDGTVKQEVDPLSVAPTASTTVALALGDALAATLMHKTGFTHEQFSLYHPGGQLGKNVSRLVETVMHREVPIISSNKTLKEAVIAMSYRPLGAVCVVDDGHLLGIITDGDVRRSIQSDLEISRVAISDIMKCNPITVSPIATIHTALDLMENRESQISVLPVVDNDNKLMGLIRLHDIYQITD